MHEDIRCEQKRQKWRVSKVMWYLSLAKVGYLARGLPVSRPVIRRISVYDMSGCICEYSVVHIRVSLDIYEQFEYE